MSDAGHPCEVISEVFTLVERRGALDRLQPAAFLESLHQHGQMGRVAVTHDLDAGTSGTDVIDTDGWPRSTR